MNQCDTVPKTVGIDEYSDSQAKTALDCRTRDNAASDTYPLRHQAMAPELQTPVPSPCINICKMVPATGLCEGCMRTIDEIRAWRNASEDEKRAIWAEIRRREAGLFGE
ncbi:DUF1289 domain-containing protein [Massilia timonae]